MVRLGNRTYPLENRTNSVNLVLDISGRHALRVRLPDKLLNAKRFAASTGVFGVWICNLKA